MCLPAPPSNPCRMPPLIYEVPDPLPANELEQTERMKGTRKLCGSCYLFCTRTVCD